MENNNDSVQQAPVAENPRSTMFWIIAIAAISTFATAGLYILKFGWQLSPEQSAWGQFGDYFGGVLNTVFSLLTLLALITTIVMQYRQLDYSRRALLNSSAELRLTREELSKSAHAQAKLAEATADQVYYARTSARLSVLSEAYKVTCDLVQQNKGERYHTSELNRLVEQRESMESQGILAMKAN